MIFLFWGGGGGGDEHLLGFNIKFSLEADMQTAIYSTVQPYLMNDLDNDFL